ncbi:MAG: hypothetical protein LBU55_02300 [Elusimicrobiota bacterium]|nr:hypothetical protein [Elusimicrobiota bacterium]
MCDVPLKKITLALTLGATCGLIPSMLIRMLFVFVILIYDANFILFLISTSFFSVLAYLILPLFSKIGLLVLNIPNFLPLWVFFYNAQIIPFLNLNNTAVMGGVAFSIVLFLPIFFISHKFALYYRNNCRDKLLKLVLKKTLTIKNTKL